MNYVQRIKEIRTEVNKMKMKSNCIDSLITNKIDDYILIQEQPLPILIKNVAGVEDGKDRIIYVGNFTYDNENKFFDKWAKIISALNARIVNMKLMENRRVDLLKKASFYLLAEGKWMLEFLTMDKWLKNKLCKLIKGTLLKQQSHIQVDPNNRTLLEWTNCSYRYFEKNITKELLIQICWLIYLYNFDSQKKSLQFLVEKMGIEQLQEMYIPFWLQNLGGLTGSFVQAPSTNIDYCSEELENNEHMENPKKDK